MLPHVVSILGQDRGISNMEITLNNPSIVGHNTLLELTPILIMRINGGHVNFQPTLNSSENLL